MSPKPAPRDTLSRVRRDLPVLLGDIGKKLIAFGARKQGPQDGGGQTRQVVNHDQILLQCRNTRRKGTCVLDPGSPEMV